MAGTGKAVGIGDLAISWNVDKNNTYNFVQKNVFHIPESPVNILGISAFSKCIGDYDIKGTRIMPYAEIGASLSTIAVLVYCCGGVVFVVLFLSLVVLKIL